MTLLVKSIKDFFTPSMLKLTLFPFILTISILSFLFFLSADIGLDKLSDQSFHIQSSNSYIEDGVQVSESYDETYTGSGIIEYLLNNEWTSSIMKFFIYTIGLFFVLIFSVILAIIIIGFLTPAIVRVIHKRHYSEIKLDGYGNLISSLFFLFKTIFITIFMFLLFIPLYFIPAIGIVILNIPFYYFFHKMLNYDITSSMMSKKEYKIVKIDASNLIRFKTLILYLFSLIPGVILVTTSFYVIYMTHNYFFLLQKEREL